MCGEQYYRASLAALWTETFLYGIYAILLGGYIYVHTYIRPNKRFLVAITVMFILSTGSMLCDFVRYLLTPVFTTKYECIDLICTPCEGTPEHRSESNISNLSNVIYAVLITTNQLLADLILAYRCVVIWQRRKRVILVPMFLIVATAATGYAQSYATASTYILRFRDQEDSPINTTQWLNVVHLAYVLGQANVVLGLASTLLLTGMIIYRVWLMTRGLGEYTGKRTSAKFKSAVVMMVESGAMFTITVILTFALSFTTSSQWFQIPENAMNQIVGIAPTLIAVRVGLKQTVEETTLRESNVQEALSPQSRWIVDSEAMSFTNVLSSGPQRSPYEKVEERPSFNGVP